jgi:predicted peroxiredoxin
MSTRRKLVIKVMAGTNDPERCAQAFTVASAALASGADVSLWLTGEASWFAVAGKAEEFVLPHSAPLADMLAAIIAGGKVTLCTQCAVRRGIKDGDQISGITIAGAASFVEEILAPDVQALIY